MEEIKYTDSGVRKVLRSEFTWLIIFAGFLWGYVTTTVLPINSMQLQIINMNEKLTVESQKYENLVASINTLEKQEQTTSTILDQHIKQSLKN
jgi:hypothetical protein